MCLLELLHYDIHSFSIKMTSIFLYSFSFGINIAVKIDTSQSHQCNDSSITSIDL